MRFVLRVEFGWGKGTKGSRVDDTALPEEIKGNEKWSDSMDRTTTSSEASGESSESLALGKAADEFLGSLRRKPPRLRSLAAPAKKRAPGQLK